MSPVPSPHAPAPSPHAPGTPPDPGPPRRGVLSTGAPPGYRPAALVGGGPVTAPAVRRTAGTRGRELSGEDPSRTHTASVAEKGAEA
ncbi:hypothetical protein ACFQ8C_03270 [Streptomyces sp. NPDC056503]|uniref:hypothetical protein n=1 Tax=Streptomyces sp. NPDC056503 TaxID=3345842 RepID=UPI0036C5B3C6